jgi:hypothetical protein
VPSKSPAALAGLQAHTERDWRAPMESATSKDHVMSTPKKDNDYFVDRNGTSALTRDGKPPASYGVQVKISDNNGGHVSGYWNGSQFVRTSNN